MSIESAKAFYTRMTEDDAFRAPFEQESTSGERRQLIANAGYDFTAEEWQAAMNEISASDYEGELNEEELEAVAGGAFGFGGGMYAMYGVILPKHVSGWLKN